MQFTSAFFSSRGAAHQVVPSAPVARPGLRLLRADLYIQQQADRALADKQARDLREARRTARECGCRQCQQAYRMVRAFYVALGRPPAHVGLTTPGRTWYPRSGGTSPSER